MTLSLDDYRHWLSRCQDHAAGPRFVVVQSLSSPEVPSSVSSSAPPGALYVLDSSFNPPTRAHVKMAIFALERDRGADPKRLMLLLATRNADKAPQPAPFEHRLALMARLAQDLHKRLRSSSSSSVPVIDVALTTCPYFHDKAEMIAAHGHASSPRSHALVEQVHLVGFDTLIRILDPKYYPPHHTLAPLVPFLRQHRLRVTYRVGTDPDQDGDDDDDDEASQEARAKQDAYVDDLRQGKREHEGGRREWADRIELVRGRVMPSSDGTSPPRHRTIQAVSSTKARQAARDQDEKLLEDLVTDCVRQYILQEKLYAVGE